MLNLVPYPSGPVTLLPGSCSLPVSFGVNGGDYEAWAVQAFLERCQGKLEGNPFLHLTRNGKLPREGYALEIRSSGIFVTASTEAGVVWALTTVANLLKEGKLPCCKISDAPRYPHRGVSLDCARHFFPVEEVKRIIEAISLSKMNVLHWHLADDQGWRIESKKFPRLQEISKDYYTQEEIRDVCQYASLRGVEIVPEIDLPGHTTSILAAYPQLSCYGKQTGLATGYGIFPVILCAGKESVFVFLKELLEEIVPLFLGPRFHIGGDEAPKSEWQKCPHCLTRMQALGITGFEDLQADFSRRVIDILKPMGKQAICWNESLLAENPPEDIQVQYWALQYRNHMGPFLAEHGKWIYSDMFELYFDYPHSMTSLKRVYETKPHLGKRRVTEADGLLGIECCMWVEHVADRERLETRLFPRVFAVAEIAWREARDYEEFLTRLEGQLQNPLYGDFSITERDWWDPKGAKRREEALEYFNTVNARLSPETVESTENATSLDREFVLNYAGKFFKPWDIPALLAAYRKV